MCKANTQTIRNAFASVKYIILALENFEKAILKTWFIYRCDKKKWQSANGNVYAVLSMCTVKTKQTKNKLLTFKFY